MCRTGGRGGEAAGTELSGFVLVGGRSSRMGRDKAMLPIDGIPLAVHVANVLSRVAPTVSLVGPPTVYGELGYPVLADEDPGFGPVGAIATLLRATESEWNFVIACDMAGVNEAVLRLLLGTATKRNAMCAYARSAEGGDHPLCGVYHVRTREIFERAVATGEHRLMQTTALLQPYVVDVAGVASLRNVNTPEDWEPAAS